MATQNQTTVLDDPRIVMMDVSKLTPRKNNPRTHSPKQIRQIADSIKGFGFTNPILVDDAATVVAGHGRLEAAKLLGLAKVPTIALSHMTDAQLKAYVIADNKLAENAGWDDELLAIELKELAEIELDFDLTLTGFEMGEIDVRIGTLDEPEQEEEAPPEPPETDQVRTKPGDIWQIGPHRLICGDSRNPSVYDRLMDGKVADLVFTDPPYNVPIDGHVCGLGSVKHREFAMAAGEMTRDQFTGFLTEVLANMARVSRDGAIHYVCMDWRHLPELQAAGEKVYSELKNLCVWAKTNAGMGSLYRSQHELVLVFKVGTGAHINNVELGRHGRYRSNVWTYAGVNAFGANRDEELASHPTVKPVQLVQDAIMDTSNRGSIVLDAFTGSGTTLVAAHRAGRVGYAIELDPAYCDVICRRMQREGLDVVHAATGEAFDAQEADNVQG